MAKTVLITGASRGIGKATAQLFAQMGYRVAITYRAQQQQAEAFAKEIGATCLQLDVADREQVQQMASKVIGCFGHLDVLVNNAGIAQQKLFTDITQQEWQRMLDVNITGMFHTTQCLLPHMIGRKKGSIVNVSSVWGMTGASCEVHYSTSKAAVIGFTKALAHEVGPSGVCVNCVAPGVIDTDMNGDLSEQDKQQLQEQTPLGRIGTAEDVAHAIAFLASDQARFMTGQVISPNGGFVI